MYQSGRAGDEAKKRISLPPKAGELSPLHLGVTNGEKRGSRKI